MKQTQVVEPRPAVVLASLRARPLVEAAVETLIPQCERVGASLIVARRPAEADESWLRMNPRCHVVWCPPEADVPRIRGAGLTAVTTGWVALTEDNCVAAPDWLDQLSSELESGADVVAGTMGNGSTARAVDWGAFFAEYGFFGPDERDRASVLATGANVGYAASLVSTVAAWASRGDWEDVIHQRLQAHGAQFRLVAAAEVRQQLTYRLSAFMADRYRHGLDFARVRSRGLSGLDRLGRAITSPLLPPVLAVRAWRSTGRRHPAAFLRALPSTLAFLGAWTVGEAAGYLRGSDDV